MFRNWISYVLVGLIMMGESNETVWLPPLCRLKLLVQINLFEAFVSNVMVSYSMMCISHWKLQYPWEFETDAKAMLSSTSGLFDENQVDSMFRIEYDVYPAATFRSQYNLLPLSHGINAFDRTARLIVYDSNVLFHFNRIMSIVSISSPSIAPNLIKWKQSPSCS